MGTYKGECYKEIRKEVRAQSYAKARLHLLELIVETDKLLPDGEKKEQILNELVDVAPVILRAFVRGT